MTRRMTVKDVAKAAGVSASVVSCVMNGAERSTSRVSAATVERVRAEALRLGYARLSSASVLRTKKTFTLAVLGGFHPQTGWFYPSGNMDMLSGINRELARDSRYSLLLDLERRRRTDGARALYEGRVDGAFVVEFLDERLKEDLRVTNTPYVTLNVASEGPLSVYPDDVSDVRRILTGWAEQGVRRVAYVQHAWISEHQSTVERSRVTREVAEELGLAFAVQMIDRGESVGELVSALQADGCEGVLCYGEPSAQMLAQYALIDPSVNYRPKVMCWTRPTRSHLLLPSIERIVIPFETMGQMAARRLVDLMEGREPVVEEERVICRYDPAVFTPDTLVWEPLHHERQERERL